MRERSYAPGKGLFSGAASLFSPFFFLFLRLNLAHAADPFALFVDAADGLDHAFLDARPGVGAVLLDQRIGDASFT